jgi:cytochrome c553
MQKHFAHAITAKDTILFGDLDVAMESLKWIAENGASDANNDTWEPHIGRVRSIATETLGKREVDVMAMAVAQLARECGACHATHGVEPKIPVVEKAPDDEQFRDHMIGHKWALDRMWAGLTNPSDEHWISGAQHLAGKPSHLRNLSKYGKDADMAMTYATRVHALAEEAVGEKQGDRRMAIFGRFLAACAGCHSFPASRPGP